MIKTAYTSLALALLLILPAGAQAAASAQKELKPDYALAARFMPVEMKQLVFSTSVSPHWFTHSDRFWFSYKTTAGTSYYVVDPATKARRPLWDNARLAEQLTELTGVAYDAQHLGVEGPRMVNDDTQMRFYVEIRADAVLPGTPNYSQVLKAAQLAEAKAPSNGEAKALPKRKLYCLYTLATGKLQRLDHFAVPAQPLWANLSPNGDVILFARGNNLFLMGRASYEKALKNPADPSIEETQLTTDGVPGYSYAARLTPEVDAAVKKQDKGDAKNPKGMRVPALAMHWSQDGAKFAFIREDDRKVADLWVIHSLAKPRPELETYPYAMPGESNVPVPEIQIFTLATRQRVVVPEKDVPLVDPSIYLVDARPTSEERENAAERRAQIGQLHLGGDMTYGGSNSSRWIAPGHDKLYIIVGDRDFRSTDACVIDTASGKVTTLIQESANEWLDSAPPYGGRGDMWLVNHGQNIIWWSERDGWKHYYLYSNTGQLLHSITSGAWMSENVVGIDDATHTLYFMGNGRDKGLNPYYEHLYRVGFDGSGLTDLTSGDFTDTVEASDDAHDFIVNASRADAAPVSTLIDGRGTLLASLAHTDVSRLLAAGYQYPVRFKIKAADGITDIYGVMYRPFNLNPKHKYPIIEYVYPGPQTEGVSRSFRPTDPNLVLAQMGFIVIEVGNRGGSPHRDKWYDTFGYGNLRDYGLADKRQAVVEMAEQYPYIDASKAGMWGHSGGGFMTAAAMLQYPTFYTAGWSESGNHDNNNYNRAWSEKYDGVRERRDTAGAIKFIYTIEKNESLAANLKGHLMLTTGDMDNNVSMVNTMQLADALIHADKRFEMLVFPGMRHPYRPIADYVLVRRMDFFAHWLLGDSDTGADIILLQNEKQHSTGREFIE
ncbi:MAG: S9 family peptidase [Acidobacteria bacterium]|nr:MAG: S9 family peptidase [Acidobacteriota bacterium]